MLFPVFIVNKSCLLQSKEFFMTFTHLTHYESLSDPQKHSLNNDPNPT